MKMKYFIIFFTGMLTLISCTGQNKIDIETIDYNQNFINFFKEKDIQRKIFEMEDVWTHLPVTYTYEINKFRFGEIDFKLESEIKGGDDKSASTVKFFWKNQDMTINKTEGKIIGIEVSINNLSEAENLTDYLKKKYGKPELLINLKEPKTKKNAIIMGVETYYWELLNNDYSIIYNKNYGESFNQQNLHGLLFVIKKNATVNLYGEEKNVIKKMISSLK